MFSGETADAAVMQHAQLALRIASVMAVLTLSGCLSQPELQRSGRAAVPGPETHLSQAVATEASLGSMIAPGDAPRDWKERMAQAYVYIERIGDYRELGDAMRALLRLAESGGIEAIGAPFALFYDDPGRTPAAELRARVCLPVSMRPSNLPSGARYDVLPRAMVVYTQVAGAYPEAPRVYPALFEYLREKRWSANGPIREIYLVNPAAVTKDDGTTRVERLVTEVQIPWTTRG